MEGISESDLPLPYYSIQKPNINRISTINSIIMRAFVLLPLFEVQSRLPIIDLQAPADQESKQEIFRNTDVRKYVAMSKRLLGDHRTLPVV